MTLTSYTQRTAPLDKHPAGHRAKRPSGGVAGSPASLTLTNAPRSSTMTKQASTTRATVTLYLSHSPWAGEPDEWVPTDPTSSNRTDRRAIDQQEYYLPDGAAGTDLRLMSITTHNGEPYHSSRPQEPMEPVT